ERASCVLMQLGLLFFWLYVQRRMANLWPVGLLLRASLSCRTTLPRRARRRRRGLVDQEVFALLAFLDCGGRPPRHRATAGPSFTVRAAVFGSDLPAFHGAATTPATAANVGAERCKLMLQFAGLSIQSVTDVVT